jgi:renalase
MNIAIIGAGISGSVLANHLQKTHSVTVFDKARGSGGRLSRMKKGNYCFDKGAQDFLLQDSVVSSVIQPAIDAGILSLWSPRFMVESKEKSCWVELGEKQFVCGNGNINSLAKWLLKDSSVNYKTDIKQLNRINEKWYLHTEIDQDFGPFDSVVLTQPAEQLLCLAPQFKEALTGIQYSTSMVLYLGISEPIPDTIADVIMSDDTFVRWLIQNNKKPGNASPPSLVVQSKALSIDDLKYSPEQLAEMMIKEAECILNMKLAITFNEHHIWRYAKCLTSKNIGSLWEPELGLGVIGDGLGPTTSSGVEAAILSAIHLHDSIFS